MHVSDTLRPESGARLQGSRGVVVLKPEGKPVLGPEKSSWRKTRESCSPGLLKGRAVWKKSRHKVQHCQRLSLPLHPLGTLMTQNGFRSIVFTQELEKLFVHRNSGLDRAPRSTVSWFMVAVYSGPPGGASTEGRRFFLPPINPAAPPTFFPAPCVSVGRNFTLCTCVWGSLLLGRSTEHRPWGLISSSFTG